MKIRILDEAAGELADAIERYEWIEPGLGRRMQDEACRAFAWIAVHPELPRLRPKGYRRLNLKVFPFYVAYFIWQDTAWIIAVAHSARKPEYFIRRLS